MALSKHVVDKINENTKKNTDFYDAAEPTKLFRKLQVEGIIELDEIDFYGGYRIPSGQFTPSSTKLLRAQKAQRAENIRHHVKRSIILKEFKSGHICFIGPAGMGKSTLLKSIARHVLSKESEGLEEIELVHFVQCRQYKPGDLLTIGEFLFGSALDEEEIKIVMKFALLCPNKILFILDSLDTLRFSADGVYKNITVDEEAGPGAILWNFFSGKVLPNCRIITSSREHSIRNFKGEVRPKKVISLLGFMEETIKQVIAGYVGEEKAKQIFAHLKEKLTIMLSLCNIPVILVYTLIGLYAESDLDPTTMTRIMVIVLQSFIRSPHMLQEDPLDTMYKLEELSHLGNIERRVLFFRHDFDKVGLKPEKATDLAVVAPGGLPQKLMLGGSVMFFTHQSFQELLGSIWIAGGDVHVFEEFIKSYIKSDHFAVIRRFLYGILLDTQVYEAVSDNLLPAVSDIDHKKSILLESLRNELHNANRAKQLHNANRAKLLELVTDLNEGKDGCYQLIRSSLKEIELTNIWFTPSNLQVLASVVKQSESLLRVNLYQCNLTKEKMEILARTVQQFNLKFKEFDVTDNEELGPDGFYHLGRLLRNQKVEVVMARRCEAGSQHIQNFSRGLEKAKFKEFNVTGNKELGPDGFHHLGKLVQNHEIEMVQAWNCSVGSQHIQKFSRGLGKAKFKEFDIGFNVQLGPDGFHHLGKLVDGHEVRILKTEQCNVRSRKLQQLSLGLGQAKLEQFHVGSNWDLGPDGFHRLGEFIRHHEVRILGADDCKVTSEHIQKFSQGLGTAKVDDLDLRDTVSNPTYTSFILDVLSHVEKELDLQGWKINENERLQLQSKLNSIGSPTLTIKLSKEGEEEEFPGETVFLKASPTDVSSARVLKCGGKVEVGGSCVEFPPNTFTEESHIDASSAMGDMSIPEQYFPVSRTLHCKSSRKMDKNKRAKIKIPIWVSTEDRGVILKVLSKKDGAGEEWKEIKSIPLYQVERMIEFEVNEFSRFVAVLFFAAVEQLKSLVGLLTFYGTGEIKFDHQGNFSTTFHVDGKVSMPYDDIVAGKSITLFHNEKLCDGDKIDLDLTCTHPGKLDPKRTQFTIDRAFLRGTKNHFDRMILRPLPKPSKDIIIRYNVRQNDSQLKEGRFGILWPDKPVHPTGPQSSTTPQVSNTTINYNAPVDQSLSLPGAGIGQLATSSSQITTTRHGTKEEYNVKSAGE